LPDTARDRPPLPASDSFRLTATHHIKGAIMAKIIMLAAAGSIFLSLGIPQSAMAQGHAGHGQPSPAATTPVAIRAGDIVITAPWTRATPGGAKVAGGYMRLTNTGKETDRLIGGSLPQAGRFEVHEMATVDNVMTMRLLEKGLEIKPGETVELKPGGFHVMFMDLREGLRQGASIRGTLVFEKGGKVEIDYAVAPIGAQAPGGHAKH
jgi:copper(I)-binding protein